MPQSLPLITVATVTYNACATLLPTLESVAAQDYPHTEHLIIDGRSTDGTLSLAQRFIHQHPERQIHITSEPDHGLYDAMNKALLQARGHYVVFLNAGDRLHSPSTLSQLVASFRWERGSGLNPAVLYGETDLVDSEGRFLRHRRLRAPEQLTWRSFRSGMLVCHQSFYVRTDLARAVPYDLSFRFSADFDWCIRVMKLAQKRRLRLVNTHLILTDYLSEGLTTSHRRRSLLERLRLMARHYGWPTALACHLWFILRAAVKR